MSDIQQDVAEMKMRLEKLESQMGFLFRRLGIDTPETPGWNASPEIVELVRGRDKISAIKAFMQETGASLKDAKEFIESLDVS